MVKIYAKFLLRSGKQKFFNCFVVGAIVYVSIITLVFVASLVSVSS